MWERTFLFWQRTWSKRLKHSLYYSCQFILLSSSILIWAFVKKGKKSREESRIRFVLVLIRITERFFYSTDVVSKPPWQTEQREILHEPVKPVRPVRRADSSAAFSSSSNRSVPVEPARQPAGSSWLPPCIPQNVPHSGIKMAQLLQGAVFSKALPWLPGIPPVPPSSEDRAATWPSILGVRLLSVESGKKMYPSSKNVITSVPKIDPGCVICSFTSAYRFGTSTDMAIYP